MGQMDLISLFKKYFRRESNARAPVDLFARSASEVKALWDQGNVAEALRVSLEALRHPGAADDPAFFRYFASVAGAAWLHSNGCAPGIPFFRDYVRQNPDDPMGYEILGALLWYSGNLDDARETYTLGLARSPENTELHSGRGQVLADLGHYEEALSDLDRALELFGSEQDFSHHVKWQAYTRNGRALALAGLGKIDLALKEFQESIILQPDNAWVYFNRAKVHEENKQFGQAVEDYRLALQKREPPLSGLKKDHAVNRLGELAKS